MALAETSVPNMKKHSMLLWLLLAVAVTSGASGCGTLAGVGKDVQAVGGHGARQ
jgi:predicted small secreted protein